MTTPDSVLETAKARAGGEARRPARDAHYLRTTIGISAVVFGGFWFTYFGPNVRGEYPQASLAVHLHGWSFFLWYLLLPLQSALAHTRRMTLHRTLGTASLALASVMVATGLLVISVQMELARTSPEPTFFSLFGLGVFGTLVLFAGFYAAAMRQRRNAAWHKRLMIIASSAGAGAAAFRLLGGTLGQHMWDAWAGIIGTNVFIIGCMVYDRLREGRVHPAYLRGLAVCLAIELSTLFLGGTTPGTALSQALAWLGRTFAVLY